MADEPGLDGQKMALVLSAGGVRAMAQLGVLKAMARYNLEPDLVVGSSGGAIIAALYASGRTVEEIVALVEQWRCRGRHLLDFNWTGLLAAVFRLSLAPFAGLIKGRRLEAVLAKCLDQTDTFAAFSGENNRKPLFLTAVDLEDGTPMVFCDPSQVRAEADPVTGEREGYRLCGRVPVSRAVRASISIPGVFVPAPCLPACPDRWRCQRGGRNRAGDRYVDGGVREFLPLAVAVRLARAGLALGVNLGYAGLRREGVTERGVGEVISQSLDIMGLDQVEETLRDEQVAEARVVVLNPMIYDVGTFELEYLPYLIRRGEKLAQEFFAARGLVPGGDPGENRRRLFPAAPGAMLYPPKGSDLYFEWLRQIKEERR
ncbi:MAG: patatin-like phospholipase family protein [Bacillota bacterium]|nr:patatin-like phospholipase family protein [Bacillota bacterium]